MDLTWEATTDESEPIAIARPAKLPGATPGTSGSAARQASASGQAAYKLAYVTPHEGIVTASQYVDTARASATFGSSKLVVPPGWQFEGLPPPPAADSKDGKGKREIILVSGPSGSGKSHWIRNYVRNYVRIYPDNDVYLISSLKKDETLDALDVIKRIDVDKLLASPPKDVYTWANSLVIIDDVEGLDKAKAAAVQAVQDLIASEGRHSHTTLIRAAHLSTNYKETRLLLQEAHGYVLFPQAGAHSQYMYLLTKYGGMEKKAAAGYLQTPSRWIYIHHTLPKYILTAESLSLMNGG